jgi:hypothetical protein
MRRLFFIFAATLATTSCRPSPNSTKQIEEPMAGRSPLNGRWTERSRTETSTVVTFEFTKLIATEFPVTIDFRLPAGVEADPNPSRVTLASDFIGTRNVDLLLSHPVQPQEDLVATCDTQGKSFGYHADLTYSFGRTKPPVENPKVGAPIQVGPGTIQPVELKPQAE